MNLLSLLVFAAFVLSIGATVPEKTADTDSELKKDMTDNQSQIKSQDENSDKKLTKRSNVWNPWNYVGYSYGWPWYGYSALGHGLYGGWYPGWPSVYRHGYGGYFGYHGSSSHGGWYKSW